MKPSTAQNEPLAEIYLYSPTGRPISLLDIGYGQCRYLTGGKAEDGHALCCGGESMDRVYCGNHHIITHQH